MNKIEKTNYINSLKKDLDANNAMMVYHYEGLNVNQLDELREKMREVGALLKVTKNRITKLAIKETTHSDAEKLFTGPTAIALSQDPITIAKILVNFQKNNQKLKIVGGIMDNKLLAPSDVAEIAKLPTLEEARSKIVGILQASQQKLIGILLAPGRKIANLAHAKSLKKD
ncbi:MAG: 50S ribosomal protein L10 [Pseudomonadota bacterium]|nr:50S ribosomal protein L10 [Pseudomonadota bacterium]|tara:strand:+ start:217 stop:729 length:513 start_codon:yes stop_codon:yes gene_type:complete